MYTSIPMARLVLLDLRTDKRAADLARLIESLTAQGRRLVVWVADEGRRKIFDDWLWTFDRGSFIPHLQWQPSLGAVDDPVVLLGVEANPNDAEVLVVGDELPPAGWAHGFAEVHDLIPPGNEGQARRSWWDEWRGDDGGSR
jgi:DNA polymerase IIIc chi subunit